LHCYGSSLLSKTLLSCFPLYSVFVLVFLLPCSRANPLPLVFPAQAAGKGYGSASFPLQQTLVFPAPQQQQENGKPKGIPKSQPFGWLR
jgi:hypothetical protein